jgi:hypothetical protein
LPRWLDPRFHSLTFLTSAEAGKCTDALKAAYIDLEIKMDKDDVSDSAGVPRPKKKARVNDSEVFSDFTSNILDNLSPTKGAVAQTELQKYLAHPAEERQCNPLDWWRLNANRYPKLATLARRYLAIPASSAASERLFSKLKLTATAARQNLGTENLCMLLFVSCHHQNLLV